MQPRVATIDVVPTALGLLGVDADRSLLGPRSASAAGDGAAVASDPFYQESLFGRLNCHWAALRGWVKDDWKLIAGRQPELYNLAADPGETAGTWRRRSRDRVRRMTDELQRALQRMAPRRRSRAAARGTPEQEERLRSLGYTAGSGGSRAARRSGAARPADARRALRSPAGGDRGAGRRRSTRAFDDVQQITQARSGQPVCVRHARLDGLPLRQPVDRPRGRSRGRSSWIPIVRASGRTTASCCASWGATTIPSASCGSRSRRREDDRDARQPGRDARGAENKHAEAETLADAVLAREPKNPGGARRKRPPAAGAETACRKAFASLREGDGGTDPEPFIELAARIWRQAYRGEARDDGDQTRCAATRAIRGRWQCSAHALILDGQRAQGVEYLQRAVAHRPAAAGRLGSAGRGIRSGRPGGRCRSVPPGSEGVD